MEKIAIRADGCNTIGMGHIMRCVTLAKEFQERNIEVLFITKNVQQVNNVLKEYNLTTININSTNLTNEIVEVKQILKEQNIDSIIVDSYYLSNDYLNELEENCKLLISIDDNNIYTNPSDIIINPNIYAPDIIYYKKNSNVKLLLGCQYTILRKEFRDAEPIVIKDKVENILVTMGGSDINNYTPKVLRSIKNINANINVIIGSGFKCKEELKSISNDKKNINLIYSPSNISEVMKKNDIAISSGGTTVYELATLGIPTILITQAENQKRLAETFSELNLINYLGNYKNTKEEDIEKYALHLIKDKENRQYMSNKFKDVINKNGVANIINEILLYNKKFISNK